MRYERICEGTFLQRLNRFSARVRIENDEVPVHVKNTGRCRELLIPGNTVYLVPSEAPGRKTAYDLVAVVRRDDRGEKLVNVDSMAPNAAARAYLESGALGPLEELRAEVRVGASRLDFCARQGARNVAVEVKGCTLETEGVARFPDAPTLRGLKHVRELTRLAEAGWRCIVLVVIQMKGVECFRPNWETHWEFGEALIAAREAGVEVVAVDCRVDPDSVRIDRPVPVDLRRPEKAQREYQGELSL